MRRNETIDLEVLNAIEPLELEWEKFAARTGASPFLYPGWIRAWWRAFSRGTLQVLALRRDGRLVGLLPLYRRGGSLHSMTNAQTPEFGLLTEDRDAARRLAQALLSRRERHVSLGYLDAAGRDAADLHAAAASAGRQPLVTELQRSPYVRLEGGWEAFERSLGRKFVADLRRRWRQLEREGELKVAVHEGRERLDELLVEGFRVEPSGWKDARGTAISSDARTERFYLEVARWAASRGCLRLAFLRLDGHPLAFQYAVEDCRAYHFLKGGYDPAFRRFAPGKLLTHAMLERAFALGLERFEFLGADEPWKLDWTPEARQRIRFQCFRRSPLGVVHWSVAAAYYGYARPFAKRKLPRSVAAAYFGYARPFAKRKLGWRR